MELNHALNCFLYAILLTRKNYQITLNITSDLSFIYVKIDKFHYNLKKQKIMLVQMQNHIP